MTGRALGAVVFLGFGCADAGAGPPPPTPAPSAAFPADYAATYEEQRACRKSGDHELDFVRVLTDPTATVPYAERTTPFSDGAVVLKEQYDVSDTDCTGP